MIYVERLPVPPSLLKNELVWRASFLACLSEERDNSSKANKEATKKARNKYRQKDVKESLIVMFHGKCAYCESSLSHISYGHIEHFYPVSLYPDQCFSWDNLLLGCEKCNFNKLNRFPINDDAYLLINPTSEDPSLFFKFEYDVDTGLANVLGVNERGITAERVLDLNRHDLIKHRSKVVEMIVFVAIRASDGDANALDMMRRLVNPDEEYSAFAITLSLRFSLAL